MTETTPVQGEEFRDDPRRRQSLPAHVIKRLTRLDPVKATWPVLQTWGVIAACLTAATVWWTPWVVIPAMLIITTRAQALFVIAHDAAHYRLYETRWLNDLVGRLCATPVGISMCTYRVVHRLHHNHLYGPQDPDTPIHGGYPRGRGYLLRKLAKDLLGGTAWKTYRYFFGAPAINDEIATENRPLNDPSPALRPAARRDRWLVAAFHTGMPVAAFSAGWGWQYLVLWPLALVTLLQPLLRFRAICEHGAVVDENSPLKAARTNTGPGWLMWIVFPHDVNYHIEHHMYPSVPCYNLPECHREMVARGILDDAEVRPLTETAKLVFGERPARQTEGVAA